MNIEPLHYWVMEREAIRTKKDADEPRPWTTDEILNTYRFCNVRREDDTETKWISENIRKPYASHPYLWLMLCIARQINWHPTLEKLIKNGEGTWPSHFGFKPDKLGLALESLAEAGEKVFTGAYIITAPATKGEKKTFFVANKTIGALWAKRDFLTALFDKSPTMEIIHSNLMRFNGWGPFLAYQAVVDMRFTSLLENAPDVGSFIAAGPGTIRGLNRIHERKVDYPLHQWQAANECRELYKTVQEETGVPMDLSDVPNILCETDKYLRVKNGEGRPRSRYTPAV